MKYTKLNAIHRTKVMLQICHLLFISIPILSLTKDSLHRSNFWHMPCNYGWNCRKCFYIYCLSICVLSYIQCFLLTMNLQNYFAYIHWGPNEDSTVSSFLSNSLENYFLVLCQLDVYIYFSFATQCHQTLSLRLVFIILTVICCWAAILISP